MGLSNGICSVCNTHREDLQHLFWGCTNAKSIWTQLMPCIQEYSNDILNEHINNPEKLALFGYSKVNKKSVVLNTIIFETKWAIWKNRNSVKYEKQPLSPTCTVNCANDTVYEHFC
jgi:hypothetical protein